MLVALLLGAAATASWWLQSPSPGWRLGGACAVLALAAAFAAWRWWHSAQGTLSWDGESWTWSGGRLAQAGAVEVGIDLQRSLLLRWTSGRQTQWFWLDRSRAAERWDELRRAVYSRARPQALPGARPSAAKP
ncbi:MAG: hypothetical protein NDJ19_07250 [Ramlibacter sp.]|nr:hypothetical protein [Ramlibacter sp.]